MSDQTLERHDVALFQRAVVRSVTLSILLASDYVPKSTPPPVRELVSMELPRVLGTIMRQENLGLDIEPQLQAMFTPTPKELLRLVCGRVRDVKKATSLITERGHHDMVFDSLMYSRKPPTATEERIAETTQEVAECLGVAMDADEQIERVGSQYEQIHYQIVRA